MYNDGWRLPRRDTRIPRCGQVKDWVRQAGHGADLERQAIAGLAKVATGGQAIFTHPRPLPAMCPVCVRLHGRVVSQ